MNPSTDFALDLLVLLSSAGSLLVGGVFFAFSTFVMRALAQLPVAQGVAAMQRINVVVINPLFLGLFLGTAMFAAACCVAALLHWNRAGASLVLASGVLYLVGTLLVTLARNVPRNNRLAPMDPASAAAAAYWPVYVREWTRWNHVRTVAAIAAAFAGLAAGV